MAASDNLNQAQFDKKFKDIAINETARTKLSDHKDSFDQVKPFPVAIGVNCNHCDAEIDVNALYHPGFNEMHFRCPSCKKTDQSSNWHEFGNNGNMKDYDTGKEITPQNVKEHTGSADPKLTAAPSWKEVTSEKWNKDGEPDW